MKPKDVRRLSDPFFQARGFTRRGNLYCKIGSSVACCVLFEPAGLLYCTYCVIPLYMPSQNLYLTYGDRVEHASRGRIPPLSPSQSDDTAAAAWIKSLTAWLDRRILPFFDRIDTPEGLERFLRKGYRRVQRYFRCTKEQYRRLCAYTACMSGHDSLAEKDIRAAVKELDRTTPYPYAESYKAKCLAELESLRARLAASPSEREGWIQAAVAETRSRLFPNIPCDP